MEIFNTNFTNEFKLVPKNLSIFSKINAQYSNFHVRIHDSHFLVITLNFYKFHNTNDNLRIFQSNLTLYRNLPNNPPKIESHRFFFPSLSLPLSHKEIPFRSIKISKTQIGGEWIRLQFARRFDYRPSIPIFVSQLPRFSAIFLNFTGFRTRLECAAEFHFSRSLFFSLSPPSLFLSSWNLMLRLDASVPAIAERAISSYDYVHAAISTYPAFLCMNFDIRAVAFPFNSVYTDFPPPPELFGVGEGKKGRERNRGVGRKLIVTSRIRLFIFQNTKTSVHERNFFNINFISLSFLHWLKTVAVCNDRLGNFYVVHVFTMCVIILALNLFLTNFSQSAKIIAMIGMISSIDDILLCIHLLRYIYLTFL